MERLILTFEAQIAAREAAGAPPEELDQLTKGMHAVRDSAGIYMSWAKHFSKQLDVEDPDLEQDMQEFLDEGGGSGQNPLFGP